MNRYQIYLDSKVVDGLDDLSSELDWSRSYLIRDVLVRVMKAYKPVILQRRKVKVKENPLLKMSGAGGKGPGDVSKNIDEIYFQD